MSFGIRGEQTDAVARLHISGELDLATVPQLDAAIRVAEATAARVLVLDLSELSFMDSTGLRGILDAYLRFCEQGRAMVATDPTETVLRVLSMTRTHRMLDPAEQPEIQALLASTTEDAWSPLEVRPFLDAT